jgi:ppGpp synthetase/RelA/SpoT-type nucleotidyltranferase
MMSESELKFAFEQRIPTLKALGEWVISVVHSELFNYFGSETRVENLFKIQPKPRVKATDSFLEKALVRKPKKDPLLEITDQVGVRFVVLLLEEINIIGKIIQTCEKWNCTKDRDFEKERLERPDYFSYQSDHYIIYPLNDITWENIRVPSGVPCEIQIRTLLQHAYAEMAHDSDYKPSIKLPEEDRKHIRRSLAKGSALIETTDDVFKEIKRHFDEYNSGLQSLLVKCSGLYYELTGKEALQPSILSNEIADNFREILMETTPDKIELCIREQKGLDEIIRRNREKSVFYRDSIVILLFWLVSNHRFAVRERWPIDMKYLDNFCNEVGISTDSF